MGQQPLRSWWQFLCLWEDLPSGLGETGGGVSGYRPFLRSFLIPQGAAQH